MPISTSEILAELKDRAAREGLASPRITSARLPDEAGIRLEMFLANGHHGDMAWMEERAPHRKSPDALWPQAKSAIVLAQNYTPDVEPLKRLLRKQTGVISVYALNRDYHDVFKGKLKRLAQWFHQTTDEEVKVFVDTAPVMEKPLAAQAGLGWQGKHTNLVSRELGSWFFIGTILTTAALLLDEAEVDHCGTCTACLDVCPTKAFPAPRQLDARRCISYLTIEHKGHIPLEFRKAMGNRIYGCDDCLAVCPWNKFAQSAHEAKLRARDDLVAPQLSMLLQLDDAAFRKLFAGSPVKRTGRDRFIRNCLIAAGNSGDASLLPIVETLLVDASPLVRAMAVWATSQLMSLEGHRALQQRRSGGEHDPEVLKEWAACHG
jgi:epoxyqueuosine reductase